jgi:Gram-negative bacterial TonB protein C-terminal
MSGYATTQELARLSERMVICLAILSPGRPKESASRTNCVIRLRMRTLALAFLVCFLAPLLVDAQQSTPSLPTVTKLDCPQYPEKARSIHISGIVIMRVTTDGHAVKDVKVIRASEILAPFAEANVRTWKFADHQPTAFTVTYVYTFEGNYKKDPATKCTAKMKLPETVTVSTENPLFLDHR